LTGINHVLHKLRVLAPPSTDGDHHLVVAGYDREVLKQEQVKFSIPVNQAAV
jgi:hypothetical protein